RTDGLVFRPVDFPHLFPDVRMDLIIQRILEILPGLGVPKIRPPKVPLDLHAPDLGIATSFPSLSEEVVARLMDRLRRELVSNCSVKGSAQDAAGHPLYYETVELLKGKQVFYKT